MPREKDSVVIHGDEIIDGVVYRYCPHCGELKPLSGFGIRRMVGRGEEGNDLLTNQSWCQECR
jgi:hypothetical protein